MEVMVEFTGGGPLDGKVLASDHPEFGANKAKWLLGVVGATCDIAARRETPSGTLLTWRLKSPKTTERANTEKWSDAKVKALMQYHEYHITCFDETDGLVLFKAFYRGIDS